MKLKTGILALLGLVAAVYGGAKFFVHYKVQTKLDELVRMASPFVELNYDGITSDLRGRLRIENIGLNTSGGAVLQIGSIELEGPGPRFLWNLTGGFKNGDPPASLVLKLNQASVPAGQGFSGSFGPMSFDGSNDDSGQAQPCTLAGLLKHAGVERLGLETLVANAVLGYKFNHVDGDARVFLDYELQGMESMSLTMSLQGIPAPGAVVMGVMPSFRDIDLSYTLRPEYMKRMVEQCAQQVQQPGEEFLNALFAQPDRELARNLGFVPGPGIKEMLRKLVSNGGTVQLTANPPADLNPANLFAYAPRDIPALLDISLSLDDDPVTDLSIEFERHDSTQSGLRDYGIERRDGVDDKEADEAEAGETETGRERRNMRYVDTGVADLHRYVGSRVKLYTRNSNKPKQGFLTSFNGSTFSVEQNIHRGTMTAHVRLSELTRAEVLRRVP